MQNPRKISGGFIFASRQILNSDLFRKPDHYFKIWMWMLLKARWSDGRLQRGQLETTINEMREVGRYLSGNCWKGTYTVGEVRAAYQYFQSTNAISITKTATGMIITICNYDTYQNPENYSLLSCADNTPDNSPDDTPDNRGEMMQLADSTIINRQFSFSDNTPDNSPDSTPDNTLLIRRKRRVKKEDESYPLFDLWNKTAEGTCLPVARKFSDERKGKCSARLRERSIEEWAEIFRRIASTFHGRGDVGWVPDFDWIIKNKSSAEKVLDGKYDWIKTSTRPSDSRYNEIFAGA